MSEDREATPVLMDTSGMTDDERAAAYRYADMIGVTVDDQAGREATACGCPEEALIRSHVEGCPWFTAFVEAGRGATSLDDLLLCQMCRHPDHDDQPCEGCQHGRPLPEEDDDA